MFDANSNFIEKSLEGKCLENVVVCGIKRKKK